MSMTGDDLDKARETVESAVDEVAAKISARGVEVGLLGAAQAIAGTNLVNENDGPDRAVDLLERMIEGLEA